MSLLGVVPSLQWYCSDAVFPLARKQYSPPQKKVEAETAVDKVKWGIYNTHEIHMRNVTAYINNR